MQQQFSSTKERLYQICQRLFYEKGYKGTTMRDIAAEMGLEAASIYNHIDSKMDMLDTWLFEMSEAFHKGIEHIIDSSHTPADKIRAIIALHIRITVNEPYKAALLANEWRNLKEPRLTQFTTERDLYESQVRSVIEEGILEGEVVKLSSEILTQSLLASLRWLFHWYIRHKNDMNPVELEKQMTEIIMRGLEA